MTPEDLRKQANAAEFMATIVSYGRDKDWLTAKAADLRRQADRLEGRAWAPPADAGEALGDGTSGR